MKTLALFGASGRTGRHIVEQALEQGYSIRALVRTPEKLGITHPKLHTVKGDVLDFASVKSVIEHSDTVVSVFGHVKNSPPRVQTEGTKNIVKAMHQAGVSKIVSLSGGALPYPKRDKPKVADHVIRFIMRTVAANMVNDAIEHAEVLENSGLQWVIVRAPRLLDAPRKNHYREGWVGVNSSTSIARADLADFILKQVNDTRYHGQMPMASW